MSNDAAPAPTRTFVRSASSTDHDPIRDAEGNIVGTRCKTAALPKRHTIVESMNARASCWSCSRANVANVYQP